MITILNIIGVVLILSFLVFIHELGHFWAARRNGIRVDEFGIGFPPKLFKYKKGGTTYVINLLPLGGYVKLHGEDSHDKKALKDKDSFAVKTPWQKLQVVFAGVFMNFLVFWILMSIALTIGVNPIIANKDQLQQALLNGSIKTAPGLIVKEVEPDSMAQKLGVKAGDELVEVSNKLIANLDEAELMQALEDLDSVPEINSHYKFKGDIEYNVNIEDAISANDFGVTMYPPVAVSALTVRTITNESRFNGHLEPGDKILSINGVPVLNLDAVFLGLYGQDDSEFLTMQILRDNEDFELKLSPFDQFYAVSEFAKDSIAEKGGIKVGDRLVAIDGVNVTFGDNVLETVKNKALSDVTYKVNREGVDLDFVLKPDENGLTGMYLSPEFDLASLGLVFYQDSVIGSVVEQTKERFAWYASPFYALSKGTEIAGETAKMFLQTLFNVATKLEVSEQVGGPVQVAKLSYHFVGQGGVELISFIALISLSLAVINILPIPALDGGRLIFVIIEAFRGKPVSAKFEAMVHSFGFLFLMGFILVVTFYDILRI